MATLSDNFNRADNTDLGANWDSGYTSRNALDLVSNAVRVPSNGTSQESVNSITPGNDQFCKLTVKTFNNAGFIYMGPCVRAAAPATLTVYQFLAFKNHGTGITTSLQKIVTGTSTTLVSESVTTWAANDKMVLSVIGQVLVGWRNGAPFLTATDSAIASGRIAATMRNDTGALSDGEIDDFFGGDLSTVTVRPSGDGTTTGWTKTGGSGTYASCIVDDPDSDDGDTSYVLSPNRADGQMWVLLDDMPTDFDLGVRATLKASAKKINTPVMTVDTSDMYLAIQRSDESTNLAAESAVCNVTVTASYTLFTRDVVISGTNAKADWDAARLRLRFDHITASTIDTVNQIRITAAEVVIPYIPAEAGAVEAALSAAGVGAVSLIGASTRAGVFSSTATATVEIEGSSTGGIQQGAFSSPGIAAFSGTGRALIAAEAAPVGTSTANLVGATIAEAALSSTAAATVAAQGQTIITAVFASVATSTVNATAEAIVGTALSSDGVAIAAHVSQSIAAGSLLSAGNATVAIEGTTFGGVQTGAIASAGASTVTLAGAAIAEAELSSTAAATVTLEGTTASAVQEAEFSSVGEATVAHIGQATAQGVISSVAAATVNITAEAIATATLSTQAAATAEFEAQAIFEGALESVGVAVASLIAGGYFPGALNSAGVASFQAIGEDAAAPPVTEFSAYVTVERRRRRAA